MDQKNKREFLDLMSALAENYSKKFSQLSLEIYWNVLKSLTLEEFRKAVNHLAATRVYSTFPLPAEFINAVHPPSDLELQAAAASTELRQRLNDPYTSFRFADPVIGEVVNLLGGWDHVRVGARPLGLRHRRRWVLGRPVLQRRVLHGARVRRLGA